VCLLGALALSPLIVALVLAGSQPAQAGCWDECMYVGNPCNSYPRDEYACTLQRSDCVAHCRRERERESESFGAIAYSSATRTFAYSADYSNRAEAEDGAVRACNEDDCEVIVWFYNSCGAVAIGSGGPTWGRDGTKQSAQRRALAQCVQEGQQNCKLVVSACSPGS
jgi:hypothetical protein